MKMRELQLKARMRHAIGGYMSPNPRRDYIPNKTVKGEHTCTRSYVSKLAKAKYLGNRVEKVIREPKCAGCRPIIDLDGCFLKTVYQGQLLVALGRDANDNMWPIAFVVVLVENREAWTWFLRELLDDLGGVESSHKWTFISDRQKGFIDVVQELGPHFET
ncbi:hypothetical protein Sango_2945900 [Sesamum angolense]|uniref:MULE transposase domain-containing protein n=1 Tax=Sesamum angolense TaxID=2727404 RepID=A0AAE1T537_9LAMI|nr:hypothetical protein Sango_2945900 [Sesamum angolense]